MSEPEYQPTDRTAQSHRSLLSAVHQVGAALASPAPGREQEWGGGVLSGLLDLTRAFKAHVHAVQGPDGLYEEVESSMPHAGNRVQYLRETNQSLADRLELLEREVRRIADGEGTAFMAVRANALQLIGEVRHQQSREVDLVYQAFQQDIGSGD